jgi:hypothetical protein
MEEIKTVLIEDGHIITVSQNPLVGSVLDFVELPALNILFVREASVIDGENKDILEFCADTVKTYTGKAGASLLKAKQVHRELEEFYVKNVNFEKLDELCKKVIAEIENRIKN